MITLTGWIFKWPVGLVCCVGWLGPSGGPRPAHLPAVRPSDSHPNTVSWRQHRLELGGTHSVSQSGEREEGKTGLAPSTAGTRPDIVTILPVIFATLQQLLQLIQEFCFCFNNCFYYCNFLHSLRIRLRSKICEKTLRPERVHWVVHGCIVYCILSQEIFMLPRC